MLTYDILQFLQHLGAVQVEFRHSDIARAFARVTIGLPIENGAYPTGAALDSVIRAHAPDRDWFEAQEAALTAATPALASLPPELAAAVPVENVIRPARWDQTTRVGAPTLRNGVWIRPIEVVDLPESAPLEDAKDRLLQEIATHRYLVETAGISFAGASIKTDRESQATITSAWAVAKQNPLTEIDWKADGGWVKVDAATMIAIGDAVFAHVQACFSRERTLAEQVASAQSLAELRAINYVSGW